MKLPQVIDKSEEEIADIIKRIKSLDESALPDWIKVFVIQCIELAIWIPHQLKKKAISLSRLRTLIFGKGYKTNKPKENQTTASKPTTGNDDPAENNNDISTQAVPAGQLHERTPTNYPLESYNEAP